MHSSTTKHGRDGSTGCHFAPVETQHHRNEETGSKSTCGKHNQILQILRWIQHTDDGQYTYEDGNSITEHFDVFFGRFAINVLLIDIADNG